MKFFRQKVVELLNDFHARVANENFDHLSTHIYLISFRPGLSRNKFSANTLFEVRIEVKANEYWIFLNGEKLSKTFPHREDLSTANHGGLIKDYQMKESHVSRNISEPLAIAKHFVIYSDPDFDNLIKQRQKRAGTTAQLKDFH